MSPNPRDAERARRVEQGHVRMQFVIESAQTLRGNGEDVDDPVRVVYQYFTRDGILLAENDPWETRERFHEMRKKKQEAEENYKRLVQDRSKIWDENLRLRTRLDSMTEELNAMADKLQKKGKKS